MKNDIAYPEDDLEAGNVGEEERRNLEKFFRDIDNVKDDMNHVEKIYKRLHGLREESKNIHNGRKMKELRSRMDTDVEKVMRLIKVIKGKLQALEKCNAAKEDVTGNGQMSSADQTRTSTLAGLGKKLKLMMDDFQELRAKLTAEYRETIEKRYFSLTGEKAADDGMVEKLIGKSKEEKDIMNVHKKAIEEQGKEKVMDMVLEMKERHEAMKMIEINLFELQQVFLDMFAIVEGQGEMESNFPPPSPFLSRAAQKLMAEKRNKGNYKKCVSVSIILGGCITVILLFPLLASMYLEFN